MKTKIYIVLGCFFITTMNYTWGQVQTTDSVWSLQRCIQYSLDKNIDVRKSGLIVDRNQVVAEQARASKYPSLSASISQNQSWSKSQQFSNQFGDLSSSSSTNYGLNSSVVLYNGNKITNSIKQSELSFKASQYDAQTVKENISLNIMDAYLQVLYSDELVKTSSKQVESTSQQLLLAEERLTLGSIAKSDYLQVKSQLATEKLTLANAFKQLSINRLTLMQLMELPVSDNFAVEHPVFNDTLFKVVKPDIQNVFNTAMGIKPQIKSAELNLQYSQVGIEIARASYLPQLSLNGGISTGYSSYTSNSYGAQLSNRISPSLGLTLSIPIYQNKQAKSKVAQAKIETQTADLTNLNTKNQLRKSVEQACVNVNSAESNYEASLEQYNSTLESYNVTQEKYTQGLVNSVDFLIQKNKLITAESQFLQSKYNLVFCKKILDFYLGIPLTL